MIKFALLIFSKRRSQFFCSPNGYLPTTIMYLCEREKGRFEKIIFHSSKLSFEKSRRGKKQLTKCVCVFAFFRLD
jgi:hypothetical protein